MQYLCCQLQIWLWQPFAIVANFRAIAVAFSNGHLLYFGNINNYDCCTTRINILLQANTIHVNFCTFNPSTPELNPSMQHCLMRFFTMDFASWTMHFLNICTKNQQIHQLFIHFINYVWYILHVSALHCHLQGALLVPSERCSFEEQSIEYCVWVFCV
jgi:hypothetical protein